jgi:REP element-mobilizing transposase RayT
MARPPRIPVMLPWEERVIYFITICVTPRCKALANDSAWNAICETLNRLDKWSTYCVMTLPDHVHLLTAPFERELSVGNRMACVKHGHGSRVVLIVSFEHRNRFTKSGTTFEKIRFELVWSRTGNSGRIRKVLPTTSSLRIGVRRARRRGFL